MQSLALSFIILFGFSSTQAQTPDLETRICKNTPRVERLATRAAIDIKTYTYEHISNPSIITDHYENDISKGQSIPSKNLMDYYRAASERALQISNMKRTQLEQSLEQLRSQFLQTALMDSRIQNSNNQNAVHNLVKEVQFVLPHELLQENSSFGTEWISRACGSYGLQPFALNISFSDQIDKTAKAQRYLIVCPTLIALWSALPAFRNYVIAHEFSHLFNSDKFPELYKDIRVFAKESESNRAYFRYDGSPDACSSEVSADYWGLSFMVHQAKSYSQKYMDESLSYFCNTPPGRQHPSGKFRIHFLEQWFY